MSLEQEVKLVITGDEALELINLPWLMAYADDDGEIQHLVSTYYDTPELALIKQGVGLRLRLTGNGWLQTVKATGKVTNGLHQRQEWEHPLTGEAFDIERLRQTPIQQIIEQPNLWRQVQPVFQTDFVRQALQLTLDDGTQVELAYDRGQIVAGERQAVIHEVELELKSGNINAVKQLAELLCQKLPLSYSDISKAAQGYRLVSEAD